ncbi:hypothetical protein GCM10027612_54400 [Microbispora bryophytorum subsp. camponoti]
MDKTGLVGGHERGGRAEGHAVREVGGERPPGGHHLGQRGAGDVLADEVRPLAVQAVLDDGGRAERHHAPGERDLLGEAGPQSGVSQVHRMRRLQRDVPPPGCSAR